MLKYQYETLSTSSFGTYMVSELQESRERTSSYNIFKIDEERSTFEAFHLHLITS